MCVSHYPTQNMVHSTYKLLVGVVVLRVIKRCQFKQQTVGNHKSKAKHIAAVVEVRGIDRRVA